MTVPALSFDNITKRYGKKEVLKGVSLEVRQGEILALVGMNGAGKTTLLKCLLDFHLPDSGTIAIAGASHRLTSARQPLAYLPERFMPPYFMSGQDFLKYMLSLQDLQYDRAAAVAMLSDLDLEEAALDKVVRSYSKGMSQKLGLAACLLARKALYVLDEPMSGLDPKARALLKVQLKALRERGSTLFFSSHALADVDEICDRMAILHGGQLRFIGSPAECRSHYASTTLEQAYMACIGEVEPA
ncbi:ABC transporter ATP-binding protein [Massilia sp. CF038]|uniref:ABC transporter ATP-binding protein n=1 Tax=Massilia sp. CF038 TaxID=1881045 RepID=UPI00091A36F6|nr:ABC transporter ATP-binding protein [Massilia sp. CF038]SHG71202.1 ABC-2 type transport system ATP-binding protein [Massilia sp. CF038]